MKKWTWESENELANDITALRMISLILGCPLKFCIFLFFKISPSTKILSCLVNFQVPSNSEWEKSSMDSLLFRPLSLHTYTIWQIRYCRYFFFSKKQIYERNICETHIRETRENERILEILESCVFTVVSPWDNESHLF